MVALYMIAHQLAHQGETMLVRRYGRKYGAGGMLFNGVICLFAMLFFLISDRDGMHFVSGIWGYGLVNALLYAAGFYFAYLAHSSGNYFLTQTICSMSFIVPIIYGLFFLHEAANAFTYIALVLSIASVLLMCYARREKSGQKENSGSVSAKWLLSVLIVLLSNGLITVVSKMQQSRFDGQHSNEFMVITLTGASLFLFIMGAVLERKSMLKTLRQGCLYGIGAGLLNGFKNALNLALIMLMPLSILTPVNKAVGLLLGYVVSVFLYKEKYTKLHYLSMLLSIISIALMQLS